MRASPAQNTLPPFFLKRYKIFRKMVFTIIKLRRFYIFKRLCYNNTSLFFFPHGPNLIFLLLMVVSGIFIAPDLKFKSN